MRLSWQQRSRRWIVWVSEMRGSAGIRPGDEDSSLRGGTSLCSHVEGEGLLKERFLGLLLNMVITLLGVGEPGDPNHASMRNAVSA
jgi:hypothetical protein